MEGTTITPVEAVMMMNKFTQMYNTTYNSNGSMFENINAKDPQSTNHRMESFYEYMKEHQILLADNPLYIETFSAPKKKKLKLKKPVNDNENKEEKEMMKPVVEEEDPGLNVIRNSGHEIYALVNSKKEPLYLSLSYISLLLKGVNERGLTPDWMIIRL